MNSCLKPPYLEPHNFEVCDGASIVIMVLVRMVAKDIVVVCIAATRPSCGEVVHYRQR